MNYAAMSDDVLLPGNDFYAELVAMFTVSELSWQGPTAVQPVTGGKPGKALIWTVNCFRHGSALPYSCPW